MYVHLAVPIHFLRRSFHARDGFSLIFLALTSLKLFSASLSSVARDEEITEGHETFRQFMAVPLFFWTVVDHDLLVMPLDEFKSVPTDPKVVGRVNLPDISRADVFQNGPSVSDVGADVLESLVVRLTSRLSGVSTEDNVGRRDAMPRLGVGR